MENLDLNSIQKTEVLVSNAAKDKILIKPKRTSTRHQPARKQQDSIRPACLPKLAEEMRSKPVVVRGNQESVSGGGTSDQAVTLSNGKPQLPTLTSGQTKMDANSSGLPGSKPHLPVFSTSVRGNKGDSLLASPTSPTTTTLTPLSAVTTPTSPNTKFPPSCKTLGIASLTSQTASASSHLTTPPCSSSASRTCPTMHHPNDSSMPAATLVSGQSDSQKAAGEIKTEINIKSMMNRFQPPPSNKSSPCRTVKGKELDTNATPSREESQPRQWGSQQVLPSVHDDKSTDSSVAASSTAAAKMPANNSTKVDYTHHASVESLAASAHEAPWVRKKKELLVGIESNTSRTAANSVTGASSSIVKSATATNSTTGATSSVVKSATATNSTTGATNSVVKSATATNSTTGATNSVVKSATTTNSLTSVTNSVVKSATATTVCLSSTQDNVQRLSNRLSDPPSSLESKSQGIQKNVSTDETDSTTPDSTKTTSYQVNSMKTSRSFFDCSSRLNMQTNSLTANTSKSTSHLKSLPTGLAHSPGDAEADRKPLRADGEASRTQRHIGMSAFHSWDTPTRAVSSVSAFNLPSSSSASNKTYTFGVASNPDNAGTSASSPEAAALPVQPSSIHPSLVASVKTTVHLAPLPKPAGVSSQPSPTTTAHLAPLPKPAGVSSQPSPTTTAHLASLPKPAGVSSQPSPTTTAHLASLPKPAGVSSQPSSTTTAHLASLPKPAGVSSQPSPTTAATVSAGAPRSLAGHNKCPFAPHMSVPSPNFGPSSVATSTSSRVASPLSSVSASSSAVSTPNTAATSPPVMKVPASQVYRPHIAATIQSATQTASATHTLPTTHHIANKPQTCGTATKPSDRSTVGGKTHVEGKATDAGVKVPPWRANQLMTDVQVEIVDRKACNHGNMLEPSRKAQLTTDTAIIEQTDKLCGKPSKVLNMVKNFQNCQIPS